MLSIRLKNVLKTHSQLYPLMEAEDLVKLIYQFTLGASHLLTRNLNEIKQQIILEASTNLSTKKEIIYIGNNFYRVSLVNDTNYLTKICEFFVKTAQNPCKNAKNLENNLKFSIKYLSYFNHIDRDYYVNFINDYLSKGPYPISHSKTYKEMYKPCYRIIHKKYLKNLIEN